MNTGVLGSPYNRVWAQFYKAALFELDANTRERFHEVGDNIEEEQAVDDAMYALHAVRSPLKCRPNAEKRPQELAA